MRMTTNDLMCKIYDDAYRNGLIDAINKVHIIMIKMENEVKDDLIDIETLKVLLGKMFDLRDKIQRGIEE